MKRLLLILLFIGVWNTASSQIITQTYIDRCTNIVYTFTVTPNGQSVVTFYNRSQIFTAQQFTNGTLQAWLEETYTWWSTLNPCSAAQAESQTVQQTAQQTTQAATNAAAAAPPPPPNTSTNATANTSQQSSGTSANTGNQSTNSTSSSSTESTQSGTSGSSDSGGSTESGSSDSGNKSQETKSEETKTEETKTEDSEVKEDTPDESSGEESDESSEENKKEESDEKESESDEDEDSEEKDSEEKSDDEDEKEGDKDKKKKRNLAPPILAANLMTMQMLDGTWSTAASFGVSQSSLTGLESYGVNAMVWSNLQQFSIAFNRTKTHMWSEYEGANYIISHKGTRTLSKDENGMRPTDRQNKIHHVGSTTLNYMYIYGTNVITAGYSRVILGQNENFWNGFAGGYALTNSFIILPQSTLMSPAVTFFGTKPVVFKGLPRWSFAPMTAISLTPIQATIQDNKLETKFNENFTYILGSGANFQLTQRFVFNIGINTINNTDPIIPTTFAFTIGARLAF